MLVSVIVSDRVIVLNGEALVCDLPASAGVRALQWDGTAGHIERDDGQNEKLRDDSAVRPYIAAWEAERDRRAAAAAAKRMAYRASPQFEVDLLVRIDTEAEGVRARYITPGAGQAMVYQAKQAEARRYRDAGYPADLAGYALLAAEVGITTGTARDIADLWLAMEVQWLVAAGEIERRRLVGKGTVRAAITPDAKEAAAVIDWSGLPAPVG